MSVDVPPLLAEVSRVLRSDAESAGVVDEDGVAERTRFKNCKASFTFDFSLRLRFLVSVFSSSEWDDDEDDDDVDEADEAELIGANDVVEDED